MSEYIITDKQAKEITDHLPTFYLPTWLYKWAERKTVNVGKAAYQVNDVHVGVKLPEVVRCRDCKHGYKADLSGNWYECMKPDGNGDYARWDVEPYGFCAWGERNERETIEVWQPAAPYDVTCHD